MSARKLLLTEPTNEMTRSSMGMRMASAPGHTHTHTLVNRLENSSSPLLHWGQTTAPCVPLGFGEVDPDWRLVGEAELRTFGLVIWGWNQA